MYQEFCCYSDLKDINAKKKKESDSTLHCHVRIRVLNGKQSFLTIKIHVSKNDLDSHLFWSIFLTHIGIRPANADAIVDVKSKFIVSR